MLKEGNKSVHDNTIAAAAGALASSLNFRHKGVVVMIQIFVSGFFLSIFGTVNLIEWLKANYDVLTSYAICYFLVAYFGNIILDRAGIWLKSVKVSLWKRN